MLMRTHVSLPEHAYLKKQKKHCGLLLLSYIHRQKLTTKLDLDTITLRKGGLDNASANKNTYFQFPF